MIVNFILQTRRITSEKHSSDHSRLGNFKHLPLSIGNGKIELKIYLFMKSFSKKLLSTDCVSSVELNRVSNKDAKQVPYLGLLPMSHYTFIEGTTKHFSCLSTYLCTPPITFSLFFLKV